MHIHLHIALFAASIVVLWIVSGVLIEATDRVARRYRQPGFAVAFFALGILTSISEISVAANATLHGVPQVSAGNLVGASFVLFALLIPLLAVVGHGIPANGAMTRRTTILLLFVVLMPAVLLSDGNVTREEGLLLIVLYLTLLYAVRKKRPIEQTAREAVGEVGQELLKKRHATIIDGAKILVGAVLIFAAGSMLVDESVFFSRLFGTPASFIGLLLLAIGTNIPELVIAVRCVMGRHKDIAFGDYLGSAAANTPLLGLLPLFNGPFRVESAEFATASLFMAVGLMLFYVFSRSKGELSRREGMVLLALYVLFVIVQLVGVSFFYRPAVDLLHSSPMPEPLLTLLGSARP